MGLAPFQRRSELMSSTLRSEGAFILNSVVSQWLFGTPSIRDRQNRSRWLIERTPRGGIKLGYVNTNVYLTLIGPAEQQLKVSTPFALLPTASRGTFHFKPFQALVPGSNHYPIEDRALYHPPSLK